MWPWAVPVVPAAASRGRCSLRLHGEGRLVSLVLRGEMRAELIMRRCCEEWKLFSLNPPTSFILCFTIRCDSGLTASVWSSLTSQTHPLSDSSFIAALSKYWCWKYIFYIHSLKVRRTAAELHELTSSFSVTLVIFFLSNRVDIQSHVIRDVCSDLELLLLPLVLTYLLQHYKKHPNRTGSLWRTHRTSSPGPLKSFPWLPLYNAQNIQKDLQNLLKDQKNLPKNPQHPHMDP